jgi:hypothetical protein
MRVIGFVSIAMLLVLLPACAGKQAGRDGCSSQLDAAWRELDIAKAEGFSGTVSYSKAVGLLSLAKTQQTIERYPSCIEKAQRARYYIAQSRKGQ